MTLQSNCIYYFLNDKEENIKKKNKIYKITTLDFFVRNELTNVDKIKKILNYDKFYYICQNSSELQITSLEDGNRNIKSGIKLKNDDTVLMKFEDKELIYLKNYLKELSNEYFSLSSSANYILILILFYQHLLKSIDLLVSQQIVHNYINFDSIVIDKQSIPLITNFSFSMDITNIQNIKHYFIEYNPSYLEWPLELHLISYLYTNKLNSLSNSNIEYVINDVSNNHYILKTFGEAIVSTYNTEALTYFKKYVNQSYECILTDILHYYYTWDNYALSIMYLRILIGIHKSINKKNKFIILFMKLLVNNIHSSPLKRLSIILTTNQFDKLMDSLETKDFKEVINGLI